MTSICAMSASGQFLPPMLIFPRQRMLDQLVRGAPAQSVGFCSPNGWTDCDLFVKWLQHFVSITNASTDNPQVIILDGHNSHTFLEAIMFAVEHGIHLITLPPHCTHTMQPLDRTYFKALTANYNAAADSWMVSNPGNRITFFQMAELFGKAFAKSSTQDKAVSGFRVCGLSRLAPPTSPSNERPPVMYGHCCLVPRPGCPFMAGTTVLSSSLLTCLYGLIDIIITI